MRPDNEYTLPEQRFFIPKTSEVEYHESFNVSELPRTEKLPGDETYVLYTDRKGRKEQENIQRGGMVIESGSTIDAITTIESGEQLSPQQSELKLEYFRHRGDFKEAAVYEPTEGDLLIVQANLMSVSIDSPIRELTDDNNILLLPAGAELPFEDGTTDGKSNEKIKYQPIGAITADMRLLSWPGQYGHNSNDRLVDLCIVSAHIANRVEHALLVDEVGSGSLIGQVTSREALSAYLKHFDQTHGTQYFPEKEPRHRKDEFPEAVDEDMRQRYDFIQGVGYRLFKGDLTR